MPTYKWILTMIAPLIITIIIAIANLFLTVEKLKASDGYQHKKLDEISRDVKELLKRGE